MAYNSHNQNKIYKHTKPHLVDTSIQNKYSEPSLNYYGHASQEI